MRILRQVTWMAVGVMGLNAGIALAQMGTESARQAGQQQATELAQQQLQGQMQQQLQRSMENLGVPEDAASQQAKRLAEQFVSEKTSQSQMQRDIQKTLTDAGVSQNQAQTESRQLAEQLTAMHEKQMPAQQAQQPQQRQWQRPSSTYEANIQTISGTIVDVESYLKHGPEIAKTFTDRRSQLDKFDPIAVLTDDGQLYLLLDRYEDIQTVEMTAAQARQSQSLLEYDRFHGAPGAPAVAMTPREQDPNFRYIEAQPGSQMALQQEPRWEERPERAETTDVYATPRREPVKKAEPAPARSWERSQADVWLYDVEEAEKRETVTEQKAAKPAEERTDIYATPAREAKPAEHERRPYHSGHLDSTFDPISQQEFQQRQSEHADDAAIAEPMRLRAGDKVTITGEVLERGGLKGVVVSGVIPTGQSLRVD